MGSHDFKAATELDCMELLLRFPFYGRVICQCELVPVHSPNAPVACNDCRRIYLAERAYMALPSEERLLVLAHEVLHITLRHAFRCGNRDGERFSFAADAEIYPLLRQEFSQAKMDGYDEAWNGLTAEEIYERLPEELPGDQPKHCYPSNTPPSGENPDEDDDEEDDEDDGAEAENPDDGDGMGQEQGGGEEQDPGGGKDQGQGKDSNAIDGQHQREGGDKKDSQGGDVSEGANGTETGNGGGDDDSDIGESRGKAPRPSFDADSEMFCRNLSAEAQIELEAKIGSGDGACNQLLRLLDKINIPHVNWKALLRQFIREVYGGSYCWLPPNRRFISKGLYLPGRRQKMFRGVVALDTSGSTVLELPKFVSEVEQLIRSFGKFELTVIECDAAIGNVTVVNSETKPYDWSKHRFSGGGWTNFTPVFDYISGMKTPPNMLIFFTDGCGICPATKPRYPVLWLLTEDGERPVPWGVPVKMLG